MRSKEGSCPVSVNNTDTGHTKTTMSTKESSSNDEEEHGGTVIHDLCDAVLIINAEGTVTIDEESDNIKKRGEKYESSAYKSIQRQPISVPEGTTLLLRNLRNCCVTM